MKGNRYINIAIGSGFLLLIPLVLTLRDGGVEGVGWNWKPGGFVVVGALLFCTGVVLDFAWRKIANPVLRVVVCAAIVLALLLFWAELATDAVSRALGLL